MRSQQSGLVVAAAEGVLRLVEERLMVVVAVAAYGVSDLLRVRLLALRLESGGGRVRLALDGVASLLSGRLLGIGLQGGGGLVTETLTSVIRHV